MQEPYDCKLIRSGTHIEIFDYQKMIYRIGKVRLSEKTKQFNSSKRPRHDNLVRSRMGIRRLVNANFSNQSYTKFLTLTYSYPMTDFKHSNVLFMKFVQRMKYHYGKFKYIAVTELQTKSTQNVHYHVLSDLPFIPHTDLASHWGQGFVFINAIDKIKNLGVYMSKYLNKQFSDPRFHNVKKYFYSRNLVKPVIFKGVDALNYLDLFKYDIDITYACSFHNEYTGKIDYSVGEHQCLYRDILPLQK